MQVPSVMLISFQLYLMNKGQSSESLSLVFNRFLKKSVSPSLRESVSDEAIPKSLILKE